MAKRKVKSDSAKIRRSKSDSSTLKLVTDYDIALDFSKKVYDKIGSAIKSIILFGSTTKESSTPTSDIDVMIILDDASVIWDDELIAWYREELGKLIHQNPYVKTLHVNTVRLTTWWSEMIRGEPVVLNVIRSGVPLIDHGGFFSPLKALLNQGKLKSTPEMIYITLGRAPGHLIRAKSAIMSAMESVYWAFVDSSHSVLIASKQFPSSPENIGDLLHETFVEKGTLNKKYVDWYKEVYTLTHKLLRGDMTDINAEEVQLWRQRADEYIGVMAGLIKDIID